MMHLFDFLRKMLPANFTTESTESTEKKQSKGRDGSPSRPKKSSGKPGVRQRAAASKRPCVTGKKSQAAKHGAATETVPGLNAPAQKSSAVASKKKPSRKVK